ncbi:MAG: efflux RND transporter permease subunit, partial [Bdellovibrionota bacterium]
MRTMTNFFIKNGKFTFVVTAFLIIFGILGLRRMNSESFPSVNFAMATITTSYDGASAKEIETKITRPIEDEIRGVSGLRDVRSISQPGLSSIFVRADIDNIDVVKVMSDLQRAVDRVSDLPNDLREQPKFQEVKSEEFPVYEIAISGDNTDRKRDFVANALKEDLEDNLLVKDVRLAGYSERAFQIFVDMNKLRRYHIGINEVMSTIQARNVNVPGGPLRQEKNQFLLRMEGKVQSSSDIANIPIRSNFQGQRVLVKDVAQVLDSEEEKRVLGRLNGEEATFVIVTKKGGADTIKLVNGVAPVLERYKKQYDKLLFHVYNNESIKVQRKLDVLNSNALQGMILVLLFLLIFLPGKIGLMSSLSLPLAVMATFGMMPLFGMNFNSITVLGLVIAIGMLVDNAIVISDNFTRLRSEGASAENAALDSVQHLWIPITGTALTTIAAFLPMLVTKGIMGQFIKFIPIIVSLSLLISLVESFWLLPPRLVLIGRKMKFKTSAEDWFTKYRLHFENLVAWTIDHRYRVSLLCSLLIIFSLFLIVKVNKFVLFPAEQTEIYVARFDTP